MKHVLVLLLIILALIPAVFAEDDKWIDGITYRLKASITDVDFSYKSKTKGLYGRLSFFLGYNAIIFFGVIIFLLTSTMSQL